MVEPLPGRVVELERFSSTAYKTPNPAVAGFVVAGLVLAHQPAKVSGVLTV